MWLQLAHVRIPGATGIQKQVIQNGLNLRDVCMLVEDFKVLQLIAIGSQECVDNAADMEGTLDVAHCGAATSAHKRFDILFEIVVFFLNLPKIAEFDCYRACSTAAVKRFSP